MIFHAVASENYFIFCDVQTLMFHRKLLVVDVHKIALLYVSGDFKVFVSFASVYTITFY